MLSKRLLGLGMAAILMTVSVANVNAAPTETAKQPTTEKQPTDVKSVPTAPTTVKTSSKNILQVAQAAGSFKTFIKAVEAAGLQQALENEGPSTVFAPTDAAFAKLPKGQLASLLKKENRGKLRKVLTYHIIPERILYKDLIAQGNNSATVRSTLLTFKQSGKKIKVNGASIVKADMVASNGVVHSIDRVLIPKSF
jgi:uncharacterized surface protein with fasciclin (FAS1) repeats